MDHAALWSGYLRPSGEVALCCSEKDDEEVEYGKWIVHTAATNYPEDEKEKSPENKTIWPHWSQGVPRKLRREVFSPAFVLGGVSHNSRMFYLSLELRWNGRCMLSSLSSRTNNHLLPGNYTNEWRGVYRIFSPETAIDRFCGKDPTGTLYLGRAGSERGWSILRNRIKAIATKDHHAMKNWSWGSSEIVAKKYPWDLLAVEWAYTAERLDHEGKKISQAPLAEGWLLDCYYDSYGEYPPLNQKR
jgi:hypothetical protein